MGVRLYAVPASHPCAAVEAALELKGIAYRRVDLIPALHKAAVRWRFGAGTVPAVVLDDGRKVVGSRAIVRALEALQPEPPLLPPAGTDERRHVDEADQWGDEALQPMIRRLLWHAMSVDRDAQLSYLEGARLVPPTPRAVARLSGGAVAWLARRANGVSTGAVRADLAHLSGHLDRVDRWIADGVLGGERPNAADLQIFSGLRLLLTLEDLAPMLAARPAGALARRWFPRYPGHTPAGAIDPAWLP